MSSTNLGKEPSLLRRSKVGSFSRASARRKVTVMRRMLTSSSCRRLSEAFVRLSKDSSLPVTDSGRADFGHMQHVW